MDHLRSFMIKLSFELHFKKFLQFARDFMFAIVMLLGALLGVALGLLLGAVLGPCLGALLGCIDWIVLGVVLGILSARILCFS